MPSFQSPQISTPTYEKLAPNDSVQQILKEQAVSAQILKEDNFPNAGEIVGVRLNLNVLKATGIAVQTLHQSGKSEKYKENSGLYKGKARGYSQIVVLKNAYFNVNQTGREKINTGQVHKFPMASIDGELYSVEKPSNIQQGVEIRFNPKEQHLFVDSNNQAIRFAEEVVIIGHRAFAIGNIEYHSCETAPKKRGSSPSNTLVLNEKQRIYVQGKLPQPTTSKIKPKMF